MSTTLSHRTLNRTLLARQMLLQRTDMPIVQAVEHLGGLQAQAPIPPYLALWARLKPYKVDALSKLIIDRSLVRMTLWRGTLHLISADDVYLMRTALQPELNKWAKTVMPPATRVEVDLEKLARITREYVDAEPRTVAEIGAHLEEHFPGAKARELSTQAQMLVPMIQVPPRGIWGVGGVPQNVAMATWLGRELPEKAAVPELVERYLRAFGPATLADMQAWSRLVGLKAHAADLDLVEYRNEDGKVLLDVPDGVIVPEDVPAPARLLPAFDNVLLGHADRRRIMSEDARSRWGAVRNAVFPPTFLVDGFLRGTWNVVENKDAATLTIEPYSKTTKKDMAGVIREAKAVLKVMAPKKPHVVVAP
ncbi:winged helix DNA-binding domain-containing protein [Lentzea sp. DG1S-22]|uniref:winged helix DNA-binding domain-containing protein n=1 Tax=Lentzea sp. DG1S-22 TaxID=3108822 RepID=UPI002E76033B|nr:winged helix DNA-binding domain-containing protein [Lentzea sp. DG1S-22]WVH80290.1 winged helix DNA-binding domain-containing protein [Lentzea sp. DG1S-22]